MKSLLAAFAALAVSTVFAGDVLAGACDTNAHSLDVTIERRCTPKPTVAEKCACAQAQFDMVAPKVPACQAELRSVLTAKKLAYGCASEAGAP